MSVPGWQLLASWVCDVTVVREFNCWDCLAQRAYEAMERGLMASEDASACFLENLVYQHAAEHVVRSANAAREDALAKLRQEQDIRQSLEVRTAHSAPCDLCVACCFGDHWEGVAHVP